MVLDNFFASIDKKSCNLINCAYCDDFDSAIMNKVKEMMVTNVDMLGVGIEFWVALQVIRHLPYLLKPY